MISKWEYSTHHNKYSIENICIYHCKPLPREECMRLKSEAGAGIGTVPHLRDLDWEKLSHTCRDAKAGSTKQQQQMIQIIFKSSFSF